MARTFGGGQSGMGGGGSRSTSHHRSGGGRGSSSFSGGGGRPSGGARPSHRPAGHGGPSHRPPNHRPPHHRPPNHRPPHHRPPHHRTPHYGTGYRSYRRSYRRGTGCGSLAALVIVILVITFVIVAEFLGTGINMLTSAFGGGVSWGSSTKNREKLSANLVNVSTEWYTDELGWIEYEGDLINGMKTFYNKTGIQPYLYLVDADGKMSMTEMSEFANTTYDKLFNDEGHILLCYFSCENDGVWIVEGDMELVMGDSTKSIMDSEAQKIFWDTYDYYYEDSDLEIEEFFGKVFSVSATKIMTKTVSKKNAGIIAVAVVGAIILVVILVNWLKSIIRKKNKDQENLEKMLNNP